MQKLYSQCLGLRVFSEDSPSQLATVRDLVLDPATGKVLALAVRGGNIITPLDIRYFDSAVIINEAQSILPASDVLRVHKVMQKNTRLVGMRVVVEGKNLELGHVYDYAIDTMLMALTKLYVARSFLFVRFGERIISARNIIKIENNTITVKDTTLKPIEEKIPAEVTASLA